MRRHAGWIVGLVLVAAGAVLQLTHRGPQDFGWFAYGPADSRRFADYLDPRQDSIVLMTHGELVGLAVMVLGLVALAGWLGFVLGRRRGAQGSET